MYIEHNTTRFVVLASILFTFSEANKMVPVLKLARLFYSKPVIRRRGQFNKPDSIGAPILALKYNGETGSDVNLKGAAHVVNIC